MWLSRRLPMVASSATAASGMPTRVRTTFRRRVMTGFSSAGLRSDRLRYCRPVIVHTCGTSVQHERARRLRMRGDNRSALLRGARTCLDESGYARTRARDVASAAGVSTAAIGYHFGTTDALLIQALLDGLEEWSVVLDQELNALPDADFPEHLANVYRCVVQSFEGNRGVLAASFELMAQADDNEQVRQQLRHAVEHARSSLVSQILRIDADTDQVRVFGTAGYAMLSGLIVQWLVDPDNLPTPEMVSAQLLRWNAMGR
ncbi:TetR/AcrR family transcriptional regulator [Nocardia sp. NPDC058666]|uniref:TetR/AcrR family transcriptional regulator n=1 Tax=Nocardia sp. NPDC058666 TaxID=3346587 RepID=UPI003650B903